VGNRISTAAHDAPPIPCYGRPGQGPRLRRDWVLSIFAIVHAGTFETRIANDGWNAVARDGRKSVLFSQMVVVGDTAGQALTRERR
jgi:methionyl aminopeptidase